MSKRKNSIAVVDQEKCKPDKCGGQPCKRKCPVESIGKVCITIGSDIEDIGKKKKKSHAKISETACISCGICVNICPFRAIQIVNIPYEDVNFIVHRYGENGFRLYKLPILKPYQILGIIGGNGLGKSSIIQILSDKLKPNFENTKTFSEEEIIKKFDKIEVRKYMTQLYKKQLKIAIKPQHINALKRLLIIKKLNPLVHEYITEKSEYDKNDKFFIEIIKTLELDNLFNSSVCALSGGELQRLVCACTLLKKANVFIFDEPTNYLDVKQRLNIAKLIRSLLAPDKYVVVIEHDLTILDYISDYVCIMYGEPSAFGIISQPYKTADAINNFFEGRIPSENMRFRTDEYSLKDLSQIDTEVMITTEKFSYEQSVVEYPNFKLIIEKGEFPTTSSLIVILAENGMGKTTFLQYLAKHLQLNISYKQQMLEKELFRKPNGSYPTVDELLNAKIKAHYHEELFRSDVVKPLNIELIKDRRINELSGGEVQKVLIVLCLGTEANIYLVDEPSACLDIEQRVIITKILKRYIVHNSKVAFVVEHDMMMAVSMAQELNSYVVVLENVSSGESRVNVVHPPINSKDGINIFLKSLNITFRTDIKNAKHRRPRINKLNSAKDKSQKTKGQYYEL